ncbi:MULTISPECIES: DUF6869 domain-containing protein [Ramlibacter]|uniref:DUF6869 domain-containing protein n=1 Tax=Ramlibacter pinisoli TaxID=2682844 RepID=A0A6N8IWV1_9BURK|nr:MULTISPECIES: hypothetical protein [Ramlibacter]MBA2961363.1 hypothetical protein [Ramlibacter sp. CGMCC 1.13660]MVQ31307.1 hypothetical protein [Ramlibacter pinisoli]
MRTCPPRRRFVLAHASRVARLARPIPAVPPMQLQVRCGRTVDDAAAAVELTPAEIIDWARAYCLAQQDPDLLALDTHPLWWAVERFMLFSEAGRLEDCWRAILAVLCVTSDPEVLGVLAAGPLEDLIEQAGTAFADRIVWQAWTDPAFCRLLEGAWECGRPEVWERIAAVRSQAGQAMVPPLPLHQLH